MEREGYRRERLDRGIKVRTEGIYALAGWQEMSYILLPRLLLIAGMLILPIVLPAGYWQRVVSITCIFMLLALGFDFLANYVGLVSLGGGFFIGAGGYLAAILNIYGGLPPVLSVPIATLAGGALCTLLFLPVLPLRGVYFAIATLMYPLATSRIIEALNVFGGTDGLVGVASFGNEWLTQYFIIAAVLICLFAIRRLASEDFGLVMKGVKDNDQSVRASGISITEVKAGAVFITASMGCLGGSFLAHLYMYAGLSMFALDFSIIPIAATVIGGPGSLVGPILGALILVPVSELMRTFDTLRIVLYSIIMLFFIVWKSEGILIYAGRKYTQFERWIKV